MGTGDPTGVRNEEQKDTMELREYLDIFKRRKWAVVAAALVMATLFGMVSNLRPNVYRADATVLLRPNDALQQLYPEKAVSRPDPNRYVASQLDIVTSEAVTRAAGFELMLSPAETKALAHQVSAQQRKGTDVIEITVMNSDPDRAAAIANAITRAYVENRRQFAVTGLERASNELQSKLTELEGRISDLNTQIAAAKGITVPGDPKKGIPASTTSSSGADPAPLEAAREATTVQYQTLYARQQDLLVSKSLQRGEAELIVEATPPAGAVSPNPKRDTALGLMLGLILGLGGALLREQLDERLRSREEVERVTNLPVLGELPVEAEAARTPNAIATHERPLGAMAESTRALRTSLSFLGTEEPLRLIVVTSSRPGEGKSTVASNLATAYAQSGAKTVLISGDLRRPRLESMFGMVAGSGLSDLLAARPVSGAHRNGNGNGNGNSNGNGNGAAYGAHDGASDPVKSAISAVLKPTHIDNLFIVPSGHLPPNPAELLGSPRAAEVLKALTGLADVVIIDTPPVLAVTDAAILASQADGVVLVASAGQTHRKALAQSVATLTSGRVRLLGVALNKVAQSSRSSYYGTYGDYRLVTEQTPRRRLIPWGGNREGSKAAK
jgi:succinoglycan biosynthesis transport protein ExoP